MPEGFDRTDEPQLHLSTPLLAEDKQRALGQWWLPLDGQGRNTPNWDVAATCAVDGATGLLLVEAKAHDAELKKAAAGRKNDSSEERKASHETIGKAIEEAKGGLSESTSLPWAISRDTHYQVCNRFVWAWKLAELGVPVVLVYLGFLQANEMADQGVPFADHKEWKTLVEDHTAQLFPRQIWNRGWSVNGVPFIPLIRSVEQPLEPEADRSR